MDTDTTDNTHEQDRLAVEQITAGREKIEQELGRVIIGQKDAVEELLITLFAGGNCLITGVPWLAKTLMVRAIAGIFDLDFHRIQFTPDLMPADITGTEIPRHPNLFTWSGSSTASRRKLQKSPPARS